MKKGNVKMLVRNLREIEEKKQCDIHVVMSRFIDELKQNWKPKTETKTGYGYHGSSKGDKIEYTMYFDEYRCEWTTKDRAFQGLIFKNVDRFLK
jgi:hypothetical protein